MAGLASMLSFNTLHLQMLLVVSKANPAYVLLHFWCINRLCCLIITHPLFAQAHSFRSPGEDRQLWLLWSYLESIFWTVCPPGWTYFEGLMIFLLLYKKPTLNFQSTQEIQHLISNSSSKGQAQDGLERVRQVCAVQLQSYMATHACSCEKLVTQ